MDTLPKKRKAEGSAPTGWLAAEAAWRQLHQRAPHYCQALHVCANRRVRGRLDLPLDGHPEVGDPEEVVPARAWPEAVEAWRQLYHLDPAYMKSLYEFAAAKVNEGVDIHLDE